MKRTGDEYFDSEEFREMLSEYEESKNTGMPVFLDADELSDIAEYYHFIERYDDADEAVELALSLSPGAVTPLTYKIHEALWDGNADLAREYLEQITETDAPEFIYDKAEILLAEERVEEAEQILKDELANVPEEEHQDYVVDVANIFADYNYPEQAMMWMAKAKQEDSPEFKELMARTLFGLGKYKESEKLWGELVDAAPFSKYYWNALASTQYMNEDYSGSVESSEYAIAISPDDPDALLSKANALYRLGNYEEALKYFERYSDRIPDDEVVLMSQGTCLVNLGRNDDAIAMLEKALRVAATSYADDEEESPYIADICQELAFAYCDGDDTDKAMDMLDMADRHGADRVQTLIVRGHITLSKGQYKKAQRYYSSAVVQSDSPHTTLLRIIVSIYDNHYVEAAYNLFFKYFQIVPEGFTEGYAYMALCCFDLKRYDEFLHYLERACEVNPSECQTVLAHIFPDGIAPKDYYTYIKDKMK